MNHSYLRVVYRSGRIKRATTVAEPLNCCRAFAAKQANFDFAADDLRLIHCENRKTGRGSPIGKLTSASVLGESHCRPTCPKSAVRSGRERRLGTSRPTVDNPASSRRFQNRLTNLRLPCGIMNAAAIKFGDVEHVGDLIEVGVDLGKMQNQTVFC